MSLGRDARGPVVPVLMYHYLGAPPSEEDHKYFVTGARFARQLAELRRQGFSGVTLDEAAAAWEGRIRLPAKPVVITFDDGHGSFYEIGAPILQAHGYSATMFLITGRAGRPGYLDWGRVAELARAGFDFQSHTVSHPILTRIPPAEARDEIRRSRDALEQRLGRAVHGFAYRGGHFNDEVRAMVAEAGYRWAVSTQAGFAGAGSDRYALPRNGVRPWDGRLGILRKADRRARASRWQAALRLLFPA